MFKPLTNKDFDDSATFHKDFAQMQGKDFERRIKILADGLKTLIAKTDCIGFTNAIIEARQALRDARVE